MKLGIIIDSSSGLTQKEAKIKGWGFLPLYISINGKEYADGVDISAQEYYKMIDIDMEVKTSATPPKQSLDLFKKMSKEFDHVIVYPLSKELSSQNSNLISFSSDFKNIHVIESLGVGSAIVNDLKILEKMAKNGASIEDIIAKGNQISSEQFGILVPKQLKWLVKGGRITPAIASMANMIKIVPMIAFQHGKLEKFGKGRVFKKTILKSAKFLMDSAKGRDVDFTIYNGGNEDIDEIQSSIETLIKRDIQVTDLPPVLGNHTGPSIVALISSKAE